MTNFADKIKLFAYGKINLSLRVLDQRADGYHNINSVMQDIGLYDVITMEKCLPESTKSDFPSCDIFQVVVYLNSSVKEISSGMDNLALKGVKAVLEALPKSQICDLRGLKIDIDKRLPIAAGIAGGSGNAAVTMLGLNALLGFPLSLRELMNIGTGVGADVPFSLMINAYRNYKSLADLCGIEEASPAARVSGIGDIVEPVSPLYRHIILANPGVSVSTKEAYEALDSFAVGVQSEELFVNDFEKHTLQEYPEAAELKIYMENNLRADRILMSGSGPAIVAYYLDKGVAEDDFSRMIQYSSSRENLRVWLTETGSPR